MTNRNQNGSDSVGTNLQHYGIKGMRWGVRRSERQLAKARAKNEAYEKGSDDTKRALETIDKIATSGASSVSNKELKQLVDRMNLEMNYANVMAKQQQAKKESSPLYKGKKKVDEILSFAETGNKIIRFTQSPLGKALKGKNLTDVLKRAEQEEDDLWGDDATSYPSGTVAVRPGNSVSKRNK